LKGRQNDDGGGLFTGWGHGDGLKPPRNRRPAEMPRPRCWQSPTATPPASSPTCSARLDCPPTTPA
jgi:hypothetical protein